MKMLAALLAGVSVVLQPLSASVAWAQDASVRPGEDFNAYANAAWIDGVPAPAANGSVTAFSEARDLSRRRVFDLVSDLETSDDPDAARLAALNASFMDVERLEALGLAPLAPLLAEVAAATDREAVTALSGRMLGDVGAALFVVTVGRAGDNPQARGSVNLRPFRSQLPIGLLTEDRYRDGRRLYADYVERALTTLGWRDARRRARDVVTFETEMARAAPPGRSRTFRSMTLDELTGIAPDFDWRGYFEASGLAEVTTVTVTDEDGITAQARLFSRTPVATLQAWQAFHIFDETAAYLTVDAATLQWTFRSELAGGLPSRSRADRSTLLLERCLGDAVGRIYVARWFTPEARVVAQEAAETVRAAFIRRLEQNTWLSEAARTATLTRLAAARIEIGYPDRWRDYSDLELSPEDLVGNVRRCEAHAWRAQIAAVGVGAPPAYWTLPPQQVNALYDSVEDLIVLPAALLQPPFYEAGASQAAVYGSLGAMIGHQLAYVAMPEGPFGARQQGWSEVDQQLYDQIGARLTRQYEDEVEVACRCGFGRRTRSESFADVAGLQLAHEAFRAEGGEDDQAFFLAWARMWRGRYGEQQLRAIQMSDPHAPGSIRAALGPRNMDAWYAAFDVQPGERLYVAPGDRVTVW